MVCGTIVSDGLVKALSLSATAAAARRVALVFGLCAAAAMGRPGFAAADVTSTGSAGLVVFPKLQFDSEWTLDTEVQISNTSDDPIRVRCYLVNANSHCSNSPDWICRTNSDCDGGFCLPGWTETDFGFTLTKKQPIVWRIGEGLQDFPLDGLNHVAGDGQFNRDSNIPRAPENPFLGEMKCFQVDEADNPVARNDLKGEATIVWIGAPGDGGDGDDECEGGSHYGEHAAGVAAGALIDASKYNAVGLMSTNVNDGNDTLCLGGGGSDECPEAEYQGCPGVLVLDHFFDHALEPSTGDTVTTDLTLVPCSQDFLTQSTFLTTVQFLVFNEFEQRMSTSRRIQCLENIRLSDIDTRQGSCDDNDSFSIFNFSVQGTLTGQSRIRAVQTPETNVGHGLLAVAEEFHNDEIAGFTGAAAVNLHYSGSRAQSDIIRAPRE